MQGRPGWVLVILMYFTLDLALPMLPGAFVFDPDDSVESLQSARGRPAAKIAILPAPPVRDPSKLALPRLTPRTRIIPIAAVALSLYPGTSHPARGTVDSAPRPEDPH